MGRAPPDQRAAPRRAPIGANPMQLNGMIEKQVTAKMYDVTRSEEPMWKLANKNVAPEHHFPEPGPEFTLLHKQIDGNMSRFLRGDLRQQAVAILVMTLTTKQPRLAMKFGEVQIPEEMGGGPFYTVAKAHCPHPDDWAMHTETTFKGLTQSSKSPEQGHTAWVQHFAMGLFTANFIRNKGGGTTGTSDMASAVRTASDEIVWTWNRIKHKYPHLSSVRTRDLTIKPVATSRDQTPLFQYNTTGSYELHGGQSLVACTNKPQLAAFSELPAASNKAATQRVNNADQPPLPYFGIFSGCRTARDEEDANP